MNGHGLLLMNGHGLDGDGAQSTFKILLLLFLLSLLLQIQLSKVYVFAVQFPKSLPSNDFRDFQFS